MDGMKNTDKDIKKKKAWFIARLCLIAIMILLAFGGIFYLAVKYSESKAMDAEESKKQASANSSLRKVAYRYEYKNLEALRFLDDEEKKNEFKTQFESSGMSFAYGNFKTVTVEDEISQKEEAIHFLLDLDNEVQTVIEGIYDLETGKYIFGFYENRNHNDSAYLVEVQKGNEAEPGAGSSRGQSETSADPNVPDGDENKDAGDYDVPLVIKQEENLDAYFNADQKKKLHDELLKYLIEQNEFRRNLTLKPDSIADSEQALSFRCIFNTQRTDKKNLTVGYDKKEGNFVFILE